MSSPLEPQGADTDGPGSGPSERPSSNTYKPEERRRGSALQYGGSDAYVVGNQVTGVVAGLAIQAGDIQGGVHFRPEIEDRSAAYIAELEDEIRRLEVVARRRLRIYRSLRFTVLTASAVTPALALLAAPNWLTAAAGAVAFLSEGTIQLTRMHDRALLDTKRVSLLGREFRMYRTQVGDYESGDTLRLLVQKVEAIREESDREVLGVLQQSFGGFSQDRSRER